MGPYKRVHGFAIKVKLNVLRYFLVTKNIPEIKNINSETSVQ